MKDKRIKALLDYLK